jgi:threonine/homoserine/homoserine lactone efflux protein
MSSYLVTGMLLGLTAGFAPGPLLALVISETLQHNVRSGVRVALSPLLTDVPIILLSLWVLTSLADFDFALGGLSLGGALFLMTLGWGHIRQPVPASTGSAESQALVKGVLANFLSPHPYLFWISVGAPLILQASRLGQDAAALFLAAFYSCLVGAKVVLAVMVGRSRGFLSGPFYSFLIRLLGGVLILLGLLLVSDGLTLLGVKG